MFNWHSNWLLEAMFYSMMGADRSLVTVFLSRTWANGLVLVGEGGGEAKSEESSCINIDRVGRYAGPVHSGPGPVPLGLRLTWLVSAML